jgi:hypothetical protein
MKITIETGTFSSPKYMVDHLFSTVFDNMSSGHSTALDAISLAKIMEKVSAAILNDEMIKSQAINEVQRLGMDNTLHGFKYSIMEGGTKYDYSASNAWLYQNGKLAEQKEKLQEVEKVAKAIKEPATIEINGATLEVLPATKTSTTTVKIELL